jgi:AraC-like DNA-binding protein
MPPVSLDSQDAMRPPRSLWTLTDLDAHEPVSSVWSLASNPHVQKMLDSGEMELLGPGAARLNLALAGGSGTQTLLVLADGLSVHVVDAVFPNPIRATIHADEAVVLLRASLSSDCSLTVPGMPTMVFNRPEIVFVHLPKGAQVQLDLGSTSRQHGLHAYIRSSELLRFFELELEGLPAQLRRVLEGDGTSGRLMSVPLDTQLGALVEAATRPVADVSLHRLFVRGKLMELMALLLDAATRSPTFAGAEGLRPKDVDLAHRARDVLDRRYADPPRFDDLAHDLGTNRNKLKSVFREVLGLTLTEYLAQRRIGTAQSLLLEGRLSIGQIAEQVGYEHQSSFTAAFRDQVGMTPRDYAQHRAAINVSLGPARDAHDPGRSAPD